MNQLLCQNNSFVVVRKDICKDCEWEHFQSRSSQVVLDGNSELLKELIKNGADINVLDESGWPPMHTAIRAGKTECAAILIKEGAGEFYYNKQKQDYLKRLQHSQKGRRTSYWR